MWCDTPQVAERHAGLYLCALYIGRASDMTHHTLNNRSYSAKTNSSATAFSRNSIAYRPHVSNSEFVIFFFINRA